MDTQDEEDNHWLSALTMEERAEKPRRKLGQKKLLLNEINCART